MIKGGNGTDGVYYVDVDIDAVLFSEKKESGQMWGKILFGGLADGMQDQKMVQGSFSIRDASGKLVAMQKGGPIPVQSQLIGKEWWSAVMLGHEISKLCGMLEASIDELAARTCKTTNSAAAPKC